MYDTTIMFNVLYNPAYLITDPNFVALWNIYGIIMHHAKFTDDAMTFINTQSKLSYLK